MVIHDDWMIWGVPPWQNGNLFPTPNSQWFQDVSSCIFSQVAQRKEVKGLSDEKLEELQQRIEAVWVSEPWGRRWLGGDLDAKGPGEKLEIFWPVGPEWSNLYLGNSWKLHPLVEGWGCWVVLVLSSAFLTWKNALALVVKSLMSTRIHWIFTLC